MNFNLKDDSSVLDLGMILDNSKYEIIDILGKGGFGIVYKVKRLNSPKIYAIKELLISTGNNICSRKKNDTKVLTKNPKIFNAFKERVKKEVAFLAQNQNENIANIYNYFEENNTIYTVMEYINGYNLEEIIINRKKIFREDEILELLKQLSNGFKIIHNRNIIHRDIKPNNIVRANDNKTYKIIDFTNIKMFLEDNRGIVTELIKANIFSPPELSQSHSQIGVYSDIYSLGMTIYFCFSGGDLNVPTATQRLIEDTFSKQIDDLDISKKYKFLITKMTQIDTKDRFQSIDEILDYLIKREKPKKSWFEIFIDWIKENVIVFQEKISNFFGSFSMLNISLPKISLGSFSIPNISLPKKPLFLLKNSFNKLFKIVSIFGAIYLLFVMYLTFIQKKPIDKMCNTTKKMQECKKRYYEIAFDENPNISNLGEFEQLVKAGVPINKIKNRDDETALNHLAFKGKYDFVKILIENGIDPNIKDNKGETGLYEAIAYYPKHKDNSLKMIHLLMDNNADITVRRDVKERASILSIAISHKLVDIVEELVDRDICSYEKGRMYNGKNIFEVANSKAKGHEKDIKRIKQILKRGGC